MKAARSDIPDILCFSHLRWEFVHQRPQHLLERAARGRRVFYMEEPVREPGSPRLEVSDRAGGVTVLVPHLPEEFSDASAAGHQSVLLDEWMDVASLDGYVLWYYTPMALQFSRNLQPLLTVFDCMDELSLFRGAHPNLLRLEAELLRRADVVFTGGQSLFEAKESRHPDVHLFPSSIDQAHFRQARTTSRAPADQEAIPGPRIGYFGVIDERMDFGLLAGLADARPNWQLVMIGPVVKVDRSEVPVRPNLHFLGKRSYDDLPRYIAGWDAALIPFALNESTRFISPTKTPEYLAAGKRVISSPIRDVVEPYGRLGAVQIAGTVEEFTDAIETALQEGATDQWMRDVDRLLAGASWNKTWDAMAEVMAAALERKHSRSPVRTFEGTDARVSGRSAHRAG